MFRAGHAISRRACDRAFAARAAAGAPAPGAAGAAASWWEVPGFGGRQTKSMQGLTGGYILHDALVQQGVTVVFGYSGGAVLPVLDAFHPSNAPPGEAPPIEFVMNRSEQCCGHSAEGFAKSTGRAGVVLTTSGPGLTNIITPLQDAMGDSVPLVALSGQVRPLARE